MERAAAAPTRDELRAALQELLAATAALLDGLVWSPEALPLARRLGAALERMHELSGSGTAEGGR